MTNHHVSGVFRSEAVVFVVRYERDDGEERADDEEEGRHDDEDHVAVGGDGAWTDRKWLVQQDYTSRNQIGYISGIGSLTAPAAEGAEVRILADLGREFALDDRRGAGAAVAWDGDGRVLSAVLRRGAPAKISSMHASTF